MGMPHSTSRSPDRARVVLWRALSISVATALLLARVGCLDFDTPGNDPNIPDLPPPIVDAGPACPKVLPTDCSTIPSYQTEIGPLITSTCFPCHTPGGVASDRDLTTRSNIVDIESTVLSQVYGCLMPPADGGSDAMLTPPERNELLKWLVCGYPDN
jgi:hypothetical protein